MSVRGKVAVAFESFGRGLREAASWSDALGLTRRSGLSLGGVGSPSMYDAGRVTRLDKDFNPRGRGPNAIADETLAVARRRCQALVDDHPLIDGAVETIISNIVPSVIYPTPATGHDDLDKQIEKLFWTFAESVDVGREMTLLESQRLFVRSVCVAGDVLNHVPFAPAWRGFPVAPAIELIDSDRVPLGLDVFTGTASGASMAANGLSLPNISAGSRVRQGVEFDSLMRRTGYHVLKEHPGDGGLGISAFLLQTERIDATRATLAFVPRRVGQVRGVPRFTSIVKLVEDSRKFDKASLYQAIAAACVGLYFQGPGAQGLLDKTNGAMAVDGAGNPIEEMEPGLVGYMAADTEPRVLGANLPGPQYESTQKSMKRDMAVGSKVAASEFTGDYGDATFSSERARQLLTRRGTRPVQEFVWHNHTRPWYVALVPWAIATGAVTLTAAQRLTWTRTPERFLEVTVVFPGFEWVNPQQEAQAAEIELAIGTNSIPNICAQRGKHYQDVIDEQLKAELYDQEQRAKLGLEPRASKASQNQNQNQNGNGGKDDGNGNGGQTPRKSPANSSAHERSNGATNGRLRAALAETNEVYR